MIYYNPRRWFSPVFQFYRRVIRSGFCFFTMTISLEFITTFAYRDIPVVMFVFYVLVSWELSAEEIEDPFGKDANDLLMDELSARIGQNVRELLHGELNGVEVK